jgi:hypothetical protein
LGMNLMKINIVTEGWLWTPCAKKDCVLGEQCIHSNYFVDVHVYNVKLFQCRYKMSCQLFLHIMDVVYI